LLFGSEVIKPWMDLIGGKKFDTKLIGQQISGFLNEV
jgi:hypothetical protein